jgi:transcriptional regulator
VPDRIELKLKLSQNHPAANVRGAAEGLSALTDPQSREIAELMRERLANRVPE